MRLEQGGKEEEIMKNEIDITGRKFGRLTAIRRVDEMRNGQIMWLFRCDCGKEVVMRKTQVVTGHSVSCGCKRAEGVTIGHKKRTWTKEEAIAKGANVKDVADEWEGYELTVMSGTVSSVDTVLPRDFSEKYFKEEEDQKKAEKFLGV